MRILLWHQHGSWLTGFVQGNHDYLVPVVPGRGADGRGRARTWNWPESVVERTPEQLAGEPFDLVIAQRSRDLDLVEQWTGRRPGRDVPAIWLEHDAPPRVGALHPMAGRADVPIVHVTPFNDVMWDNGSAHHVVVEHGVPDPGQRWSGDVCRAGMLVNEPIRRSALVGTDLLNTFTEKGVAVDVFGMKVTGLAQHLGVPASRLREYEDLPQHAVHDAVARCGVYLHLARWTSLGLSLIEAMLLGMPVVVLASTDAPRAVPAAAGAISSDLGELVLAARRLLNDPEAAAMAGKAARAAALERYSLSRFLDDWDHVFATVVA